MYHELERDDRTYRSPADEPVGGALDAEPLLPELAQPARRRHTHPQPRGPEPSPRIGLGLGREEAVERVGGRHRFRPEVVLSVAGVAFVILALLKPWPHALPARQPALIAVATPAAAITAGPSPAENTAVQVFQLGVPNGLVHRWSSVDWTLLRATDPHDGWGVAAVFMPSVDVGPAAIEGRAGPRVISPMRHWVAADPLTSSTTVPVVGGQDAYAIAVTWPHDLRVSAVTFQFVSGLDFEPYSPPLGFPPYTQVSPLPANQVASQPVGTGASPAATSSQQAGNTAILSGQFWIPPSEASGDALSSSTVPAAWQSLPWPWPNGTYRVTVTFQTGSITLVLRLQHTA
jgi:hypothetical protein